MPLFVTTSSRTGGGGRTRAWISPPSNIHGLIGARPGHGSPLMNSMLAGRRILIVEDEYLLARTLAQLLESEGGGGSGACRFC